MFKCAALVALLAGIATASAFGAAPAPDVAYRTFFGFDPRTSVWIVAQLHLLFAAFVLGVPMFAVITEIVGVATGDPRYDRLAKDFTRLLSASFATTAALGGLLSFMLFSLYPGLMTFLVGVFSTSFLGQCFFSCSFRRSYHSLSSCARRSFFLAVRALSKLIRMNS